MSSCDFANPEGFAFCGKCGARVTEAAAPPLRTSPAFAAPQSYKAAVDVAIGLAKIVGLIHLERFRIANLDEDVNHLIRHSAEVFQADHGMVGVAEMAGK